MLSSHLSVFFILNKNLKFKEAEEVQKKTLFSSYFNFFYFWRIFTFYHFPKQLFLFSPPCIFVYQTFSTLFPLSMFSIKCLSSRLNHSLRSCSSIIMASRSDNEMAEPAEKKIRLESFLDDCVASIQPSQIIRPSSPSEVNLNFAGLSITKKLKTSGRGVFGYSGGWSLSSWTLSWGHGWPTSFDHQERSPGAGRGNGRQLLRSPPPSEKYEVEPDLRNSTSSDDGYQARAPTPEQLFTLIPKRNDE